MINNFFKFFSIMLLLTSLSANALPWSTDMWDHPSIKPYEEARPYPENNIRREERYVNYLEPNMKRLLMDQIEVQHQLIKGKSFIKHIAMFVMVWMVVVTVQL